MERKEKRARPELFDDSSEPPSKRACKTSINATCNRCGKMRDFNNVDDHFLCRDQARKESEQKAPKEADRVVVEAITECNGCVSGDRDSQIRYCAMCSVGWCRRCAKTDYDSKSKCCTRCKWEEADSASEDSELDLGDAGAAGDDAADD